jgi:pimeloyl-ACP methyl ester carboxylesterase
MAPQDAPNQRLIFIHGLLSSGQGFKANLLREIFPALLSPDFDGSLEDRMARLGSILGDRSGWTVIGSSLGGLIGAMFTCQHPDRVDQLILLAPALIWPDFAQAPPAPVSVPTVIYHGRQDDLVPLDLVRPPAEQVFLNLTFHAVDDDHGLKKTVQAIDWRALVGKG